MITFFCVVWRIMKVVYKLLVFRLVFRELDGNLVKFQSARKYTKVILKWPVLSLFQESVLKLIRCLLHQSGCHSFNPSAWAKPQSRTCHIPGRTNASLSTVSSRRFTERTKLSVAKKPTRLTRECVHSVVQHCGPYLLDLLSPAAAPGLGKSCLMIIKSVIAIGEVKFCQGFFRYIKFFALFAAIS